MLKSRQKKTTKRSDLLKGIRPNAGIGVAYTKRLGGLVDKMHKSVDYWVMHQYGASVNRLAMDASPAVDLRILLKKLSKRWQKLFDAAAADIASKFVHEASRAVDMNLARQFKERDFTIDFKLTPSMRNALQAEIGDNVGLIRSISTRYLSDVEGLVMRSIAVGGDRATLAKQLRERYGLTKKRAAFIADDQNSKANTIMVRTRQDELGIVEAEWMHSHAGRTPRPSHVAADGKRYHINKGMYLDGKWVYPGQEPNCRCVSLSVIPLFEKK